MNFDPLSTNYVRFFRSVYSCTEDSEYPVQRLGSGTVVAYEGEFYLITARHLFENIATNPTKVIVSFPTSGTDWWPTDACMHLDVSSLFADDNTFGDLAVYSLYTEACLRSSISDHDFLPFPCATHFEAGLILYAFGYPDVEFDMDLDRRQHILTAVLVEGLYGGQTNFRGIHKFTSAHLPTDSNGMSGGPVTYLDNGRMGRHLLAGIIVQGGEELLHFIDANMVREALLFSIPRLRELRRNGPFLTE